MSTVIVTVAAGVSTLPAASVERIASVWLPSARSSTCQGEVQGANGPPSTLQAVEAASGSAANSIARERPAIAAGAVVRCVAGATVSTVTVTGTPGGEATPPASTATTV